MHPATAQSLFIDRPDDFGRYVLISLIGHAIALMVVVGLNLLSNAPKIDLDQQPIHASLVRKGVKRDEKLLPRKDEPPPPPKQSAGVDPVAVKPAEPTGRAGLLAALNKAQKSPGAKDGDNRKQLLGAFNKVSQSAQELQGDPDGDPNGDSAIQEGDRYLGGLKAQVQRYYDVSQTIPDSERIRLVAMVVIRIGKAGELVKVDLVKSSQNGLFDQAVIAAVKKAAPFSPPPDHLRATLQTAGVQVNFRP